VPPGRTNVDRALDLYRLRQLVFVHVAMPDGDASWSGGLGQARRTSRSG
jgi:hypothetical protein